MLAWVTTVVSGAAAPVTGGSSLIITKIATVAGYVGTAQCVIAGGRVAAETFDSEINIDLDNNKAYHAHWCMPVIRELAARRDFRDEPRWVASRSMPAITARAAEQALEVLLELGLLVRDKRGRLVQAQELVQTPDGPLGQHISRYHRAMLERAAEAIDGVPKEQRQIESLTLCMSEARIRDLKSRIDSLCSEILQEYQADEDSCRVVQLNMQMFPVTKQEG